MANCAADWASKPGERWQNFVLPLPQVGPRLPMPRKTGVRVPDYMLTGPFLTIREPAKDHHGPEVRPRPWSPGVRSEDAGLPAQS